MVSPVSAAQQYKQMAVGGIMNAGGTAALSRISNTAAGGPVQPIRPLESAAAAPKDTVEISNEAAEKSDPSKRLAKQMGIEECKTCEARRYQDGSGDPGVSFKSPTHVSPENAGAAVMSHEQEHVTRQRASAAREGREIVSQSVQIFTAVCPECGKTYVSGGVTRTVSRDIPEKQSPKAETSGRNVDMYA